MGFLRDSGRDKRWASLRSIGVVDLREANAEETMGATTTYSSVDFGVIIHITGANYSIEAF